MKKILGMALLSISLNSFAQTKIIAHRGFWNSEPKTAQNSIQSLVNAQKLPIYGSEFDVRMTKDGILVVNHDEELNKISIADSSYKELKSQKLSNGEKIATLQAYLKQGKKNPSVKLIVELKPAKTKELETELVEKTIQQIKKNSVENQSEFISFSLHICKEIKRLQPNYKVQYLNGELSPQEIKDLGIDGIDYHYSVFLEKNPSWISEAHALGISTNTWTVNKQEVYEQLKAMGVDFITTDHPDLFQK